VRAHPPPEPSLPARRAVVYLRCPTGNGRLVPAARVSVDVAE